MNSRSCCRELAAGQQLYWAGKSGCAWLLLDGSIRLDRDDVANESGFAGLAIKGDILGAETLLLGHYAFTATALTRCKLEPRAGPEQVDHTKLFKALADAERRAADAIALRCGTATTRIQRLVALIAHAIPTQTMTRLMLPCLRDMADITALTVGTVSRTLTQMQADGSLASGSVRRTSTKNRTEC